MQTSTLLRFYVEKHSVLIQCLLAHSEEFSIARKAISVLYNLTVHCDDVVPLFMKHIPRMVALAYDDKANKFTVNAMRNILMILAAGNS